MVAIIDPSFLFQNDATEGQENLVLVSVQNATHGTVWIQPDGKIDFLGDLNHNGDAFFEYTVRDEFGRESTAEVEVNLSPVNDAPTGVADGVIHGTEDTPLFILFSTLLGNDFDIDGDPLTIVSLGPLYDENGNPLYSSPANPLTNGDGAIIGLQVKFEALDDYFGFAGFTYTLRDPSGATSTAAVELFIDPVNDGPRSGSDHRTIRLEQTTTITVAELIGNDYDIEGDAITFLGHPLGAPTAPRSSTSRPARSPLRRMHSVRRRSNTTWSTHAARPPRSTVEWTVIPLNDPPDAVNDGGFTTLEDQALRIDPALLLANDTDPNGDIIILSAVERFPLNGKVSIGEDGLITFRPRADYNGPAGFYYQISDGRGGYDEAFVSITVLPDNDSPILRDDILQGLEDLPLFVLAAEAFGNDIEPDGDVLFFESATVLGVLDDTNYHVRTPFTSGREFIAAGLSADTTVTATLADGSALPAWLVFDAEHLTFTGTVPEGETDSLDIVLTFARPGGAPGETVDLHGHAHHRSGGTCRRTGRHRVRQRRRPVRHQRRRLLGAPRQRARAPRLARFRRRDHDAHPHRDRARSRCPAGARADHFHARCGHAAGRHLCVDGSRFCARVPDRSGSAARSGDQRAACEQRLLRLARPVRARPRRGGRNHCREGK